jgi:ubiquinone biosynthesis protein UbiJ
MSATFALACAKAEQLINIALSHASEVDQLFDSIDGKSMQISSFLPPCDFVISWQGQHLTIEPSTETHVDAQLSGPMLALILLAIEQPSLETYQGSVEIIGDRAFISAVREIMQQLEIDWEAILANLIGDIPTHLLKVSTGRAQSWKNQASARSADSVENYFREEWQSTPLQKKMERFTDEVVRLGSDRTLLQQRLEMLKSRLLNKIR